MLSQRLLQSKHCSRRGVLRRGGLSLSLFALRQTSLGARLQPDVYTLFLFIKLLYFSPLYSLLWLALLDRYSLSFYL